MPSLSCCDALLLLCELYDGFEDHMRNAPNNSRVAKWFRSREDYYHYDKYVMDSEGAVLWVSPLYRGFRFYFPGGPADGWLVEWDQLFRHCRPAQLLATPPPAGAAR